MVTVKKNLTDNMKRIEKLIWTVFKSELNYRSNMTMSGNNQAFYLYISSNTSKKGAEDILARVEKRIKVDSTIELHVADDKTIMLGSSATPDEMFAFQEAVTCKEMEGLLEIQKQVLAKKESLIPVLKALVEAQVALPEGSPNKNKYSANSFDGL